MNTCDIDKLRDLVKRQHSAKGAFFSPDWGASGPPPLAEVDVERQVSTYLANGTTVTALTKCIEVIEKERDKRIAEQKAKWDERERRERILRVCETALEYAQQNSKAKHKLRTYTYGSLSYRYHHTLSQDVARIKKELDA